MKRYLTYWRTCKSPESKKEFHRGSGTKYVNPNIGIGFSDLGVRKSEKQKPKKSACVDLSFGGSEVSPIHINDDGCQGKVSSIEQFHYS